MKISLTSICALAFTGLSIVNAQSSWTFKDASASVLAKGAGADGSSTKDKLSTTGLSTKDFSLGIADTLKVSLTALENEDAKRPHQAFLTLKEPSSGLEESFPFIIKESGKGDVKLTQKDLPIQLLTADSPLKASIIIASFGSSTPLNTAVFEVAIKRDSSAPAQSSEKPLRYGKLEEINHIFRTDPKSGPRIISIVFTFAVIATVPILLGLWAGVGANVDHVSEAMSGAGLAHVLFFGSLVAMEGIFFMYYSSWSLFQVLPAAAAVGTVAFFSGNKALSEVQERRLAGKR